MNDRVLNIWLNEQNCMRKDGDKSANPLISLKMDYDNLIQI